MKTQRRHELQTNVLADYIGKHIQRIKPYSRHIMIGTLLIFLAIMAGLYFSNRRAAERGRSWSDYFQAFGANNADQLEEVAIMHDGSTAALWARQSAGEMKLARATIGQPFMMQPGQLFTDRKEAEKTLKEARDCFVAVEKDAADHPHLLERARFGLAQVHESLSDVKKAKEYYDEVVKSSSESALGKVAQRRSERLSQGSVERWYNWFEDQEPSPPSMPPGGLDIKPKVSDDLNTLPERPDLSFPGSTISEQLKDIDLDAPPGKETVEPMSAEPKETPAADDDEGTAASEPKGSPKPEDSTSASESAAEDADSAVEVPKDAEKPQPKEPAPADKAKPSDKPAASGEGDTKPKSKDTSS